MGTAVAGQCEHRTLTCLGCTLGRGRRLCDPLSLCCTRSETVRGSLVMQGEADVSCDQCATGLEILAGTGTGTGLL